MRRNCVRRSIFFYTRQLHKQRVDSLDDLPTAHPHASLDLPSISSVSTEPILFNQVPAFDTVYGKLVSFVDGVPSLANSSKIKDDLAQEIFPWLKQRYVQKSKVPTSPAAVAAFKRTTSAFVANLPAASMFPLFDVWRLAILEPTIAQATLKPLVRVLTLNSESVSSSPRATLLTLLRLVTNPPGSSRGEDGTHERARADTSSSGSTCARGGCQLGI